MERISIFWFRRDLRLEDNAGLFHALIGGNKVLPIFIFDKSILNQGEKPFNRQVAFIHSRITELQKDLQELNTSLLISHNTPLAFFEQIIKQYHVKAVYANEDYELTSIQRDKQVEDFLKTQGVIFHSFKDHVVFSKHDIVRDSNKPYTVFTPYSRKWKESLSESALKSYICKPHYSNFCQLSHSSIPTLNELGFENRNISFPSKIINDDIISNYSDRRDYPALDSTTHLGVHIRFGTISIRELVRKAETLNETFLNELIWREFYQSITFHFPHICEGLSFQKQYDAIQWQNKEVEFEAWCKGKTGYPIVDAGMRQLNETGFMHNRVRMIAASFLVKHLLIDWRWGELYFQQQLLDFDFAANNGGWQWIAGSGCDAVPYFRIFNPTLQAKRFDRNDTYIRKWIPEYGTNDYHKPIVEHTFARTKVLNKYMEALKEKTA